MTSKTTNKFHPRSGPERFGWFWITPAECPFEALLSLSAASGHRYAAGRSRRTP